MNSTVRLIQKGVKGSPPTSLVHIFDPAVLPSRVDIEALISFPCTVLGPIVFVSNEIEKPSSPEDRLEADFYIGQFEAARLHALSVLQQEIERASEIPIDLQGNTLVAGLIKFEMDCLKDNTLKRFVEKEIVENHKTAAEAIFSFWEKENLKQPRNPLEEKLRPIYYKLTRCMLDHWEKHRAPGFGNLPKNSILVTHSLSCGQVFEVFRQGVKGVILLTGSPNDHTSIVCKGLGIAVAYVSLENLEAISQQQGQIISIRGFDGLLTISSDDGDLKTLESSARDLEADEAEILEQSCYPVKTADGFNLSVSGNINSSLDLPLMDKSHAAGVGLYRTEISILAHGSLLNKERCHENFVYLASRIKGPFCIRTVDFVGDKKPPFSPEKVKELVENQMWGALKARDDLHRQGKPGDIRVMIPNLNSLSELQHFQTVMNSAGEQLGTEPLWLGVMAEKKSFVDSLDIPGQIKPAFISIGSNDLSAEISGYERFSPDAGKVCDPTDPRVLQAIKKIVEYGIQNNIPVSLCGDMASDPRLLVLLVGLGIENFSVAPGAIPKVKHVLRRMDKKEAQGLVDTLMNMEHRSEREAKLNKINYDLLGIYPDGTLTGPNDLGLDGPEYHI